MTDAVLQQLIKGTYLIKGAWFIEYGPEAIPTEGMPATEAHRAPDGRREFARAHRTVEIIRPLRRLDWHPGQIMVNVNGC